MLKLALTLVLWIPAMSLAAPYSIVIHGGAGTILRDKMSTEVEAEYREVLTKAVKAGHQVLQRGGSSTEAVTQAILVMEDSPLFNAGRGAVFTHDGEVELDASIMRGDDLNAGAVTGVKRVRNPILLAEQVMLNSPHVMLMGAGAEAFAETRELDMVENGYFHTDRRRRQLQPHRVREEIVVHPSAAGRVVPAARLAVLRHGHLRPRRRDGALLPRHGRHRLQLWQQGRRQRAERQQEQHDAVRARHERE